MKIIYLLVALLISVTSLTAQVSLRTAMDFDGDGKADFAIRRPENNVWYIKNDSGWVFQQFGLAGKDYELPGDYDGDGKGDIAVWRDLTGVWYILRSSDFVMEAFQFGTTGDEPIARDYDGDGKTDLAVVRRHQVNMVWYILESSSDPDPSSRTYSVTQFGFSTDFTAPGDYDGDGKFDIGIHRNSNGFGVFYSWLSATQQLQVHEWGLITDLIAPGDYDGDGKTDYAIIREGEEADDNLVWYILHSIGGFQVIEFGLTSSDWNVQNDYDGDGITDIAVWRESDGVFHIIHSTTGYSTVQWGAMGDFPVASYDTH